MDPSLIALIVVSAGSAAFGAAWRGSERWRFEDFATAPVGQLVDGDIGAIEGVVAANRPLLRAPMSRTSCVYWQMSFFEVGANDWVERARLQEAGEFVLETPGGTARVIADGARINLPPHRIERSADYESRIRVTRPALGQYTASGHVSGDPLHVQARAAGVRFAYPHSLLRATEWIVAPGARVMVRGHCVREPDPTAAADVAGYRDALPTRPVLSGTRRAPLLIAKAR